MQFLLKKIVSTFILPANSLILLAFIGLWLTMKHQKTGQSLTALSLIIVIILSLPVTRNPLLQSLETIPPISELQPKGT